MRLSGQPASLGARCQGWGTAGHLGDGREHASDVRLPVGPLLHTPRCQCQHGLPTPALWSLVLKWPQALLTPVSSSPEGPAWRPKPPPSPHLALPASSLTDAQLEAGAPIGWLVDCSPLAPTHSRPLKGESDSCSRLSIFLNTSIMIMEKKRYCLYLTLCLIGCIPTYMCVDMYIYRYLCKVFYLVEGMGSS